MASGSEDGIVRLWDVGSGALLASLRGHTGQIYGVAFLGNERVVSGSIDGTIRFWDVGSGACVRTLRADRRYERMDITGVTGISEGPARGADRAGRDGAARVGGAPEVGCAGLRSTEGRIAVHPGQDGDLRVGWHAGTVMLISDLHCCTNTNAVGAWRNRVASSPRASASRTSGYSHYPARQLERGSGSLTLAVRKCQGMPT